jgi:hypothetical protein
MEPKMGERGPKLVVVNDGLIQVVWMDEWAPGVKTFLRYARSLDGGRSFEPLKAVSARSGIDAVAGRRGLLRLHDPPEGLLGDC